ncbi:hypothetical protein ANCCAN_19047 [Ancylostoma caninum]|uniref:DUF5641 domain-containing protein n=1 Tax=Ancylostoma caninum TaxID=29170 RepID=A0A368FWE4_ANCCA|nr:hypothetical protein ANCCAN_19047 [Ancylostoma caninum]
MCACAYLVSGQVSHLLMAKAKLPSIHQKSTIAKLELNALTLAARSTNSIFEQLRNVLNIQRVYLFADSKITLSWIRSKPQKETGIFVFNRSFEISGIAEHLSGQKCVMKFGHITSEHNPADCGTRGLNKNDLQEHFWWQGPSFLLLREEDWPINDHFFTIDSQEINDPILPGFSSEVFHVAPPHENREDHVLLRSGQVRTFTKAKIVIAIVIAQAIRFALITIEKINRRRSIKIELSSITSAKSSLESPLLTSTDITNAGNILIRNHQENYLHASLLKSLEHLNIQKDPQGILRCRGRLANAELTDEAKYLIYHLSLPDSVNTVHPIPCWSALRQMRINALKRLCVTDDHDFAEDLLGLGSDELKIADSKACAKSGLFIGLANSKEERKKVYDMLASERTKWRPKLFKALKRALNDTVLRPIDFIQKELLVSYPWTCNTEDNLDPDVVTPEEQAILQTKRQAVDALQSSCAITEKFWKIWQDQYLRSLREKHTLQTGKKRGGILIPKTGQIVLIQDEVQPRHSWKMGIINTLVSNIHGTIREAIVRFPSGRLIRRPINLLIPLELEDQNNEKIAERDSQENKIEAPEEQP